MGLSAHEFRRLSVAGLVGPDTCRRCYDGKPVRAITRLRIERAARSLGLPLPPAPSRPSGPRLAPLPGGDAR